MRIKSLSRSALLLIGALSAACGGNHSFAPPTLSAPSGVGWVAQASSSEKVLHRFRGGNDGALPTALTDVNGRLYGTTLFGGSTSTCPIKGFGLPPGCGTIFKIDTSGSDYGTVHRFAANALGGAAPWAGVIAVGSALYGTTTYGGGEGKRKFSACKQNRGCGTAFTLCTAGRKDFDILQRFDGSDGFGLYGGLVLRTADSGPTFYGTSAGGGSRDCGCGTVFSVASSGDVKLLHSFAGGPDGGVPFFAPVYVDGSLYGTTAWGGGTACPGSSGLAGCGVIYKLNASGKEYRIIHRFQGGADGAFPNNVMSVDGTLYGTTSAGGDVACTNQVGLPGCGTVFTIEKSGKGFRILHRFTGGTDGAGPNSLLASINGTLYSDTFFGGGRGCNYTGCGTVYRIEKSGKRYRVIYRFQAGRDGANPYPNGVIAVRGTLYGTTQRGGSSGNSGFGWGTVFSLRP